MSELRGSVWTREMNSTDFDFDLFFRSRYSRFLIHLASGGGTIASEVFSNPAHFALRKKLRSIPESLKLEYKLSPHIDEILANKARNFESQEFDRQAYLSDFIDFARCGCFSFDRTYLGKSTDRQYHLVAYPVFRRSYENIVDIVGGEVIYGLRRHSDPGILNSFIDKSVRKPFWNGNVWLIGKHLVTHIHNNDEEIHIASSLE